MEGLLVMSRVVRVVTVLLVLLFALGIGLQAAGAQQAGDLKVLLTPGAPVAEVNGEPVELDVPAVIQDGHTLVPLRFVAEALEASVSWNAEDRSILIESFEQRVSLQIGNPLAVANETEVELAVEPQIIQGRTMVPLRFVSEALEAEVGFQPDTKLISIFRKMRDKLPVADFSIEAEVITPGGSPPIIERSYHPLGLAIVDREWTGLRERYPEPGTYQITLRVKDELGNWSEPVTRTLLVKEPPKAKFRTEKSTYRIGEPIVYINESYSPDGEKLTLKWEARPAYFEPGEHEVRLTVTDKYGLTDTVTEKIRITDRVYYTKEEFYLIYGKIGEVVPYEEAVLDFPVLEPEVTEKKRTLLRVNSPEEIRGEGILYRDIASGPVRIMVHHLNRTGEPIRIHALARNSSSAPVDVRITRQGIGGPAGDILRLGRLHLEQFFAPQSEQVITIPAGGTVSILSNLRNAQMKPNDCLTGMWDLEVSVPLEFTFVAVKAADNPLERLEGLPELAADGRHIRGTFRDADRLLRFETLPNGERARIILADSQLDPPGEGVDALTGETVLNLGNYGVVYQLVIDRLPRDTALFLNPRGGNFCGAVRIGQQVVPAPANGYAAPQREAVVLHKNGNAAQRLTMDFSPPSGSYLPVSILSLPIPKSKGESGPLIPEK